MNIVSVSKPRIMALVMFSTAFLSACPGTGESDPVAVAANAASATNAASASSASQCAHPYPCGNEWPKDLEGPFELRNVEHVQVTSHDGTVLDGWLSFPDLPPGVKAPVILISTPYLATIMVHPAFGPDLWRHPEDPNDPSDDYQLAGGSRADAGKVGGWWDDSGEKPAFDQSINGLGVFPIRWIRRGFVLANFNLRGTGHSGGCMENGSRNEQLDQKALVDWLASQEWSNGRVGMGGLSYVGGTTWQGATQAPAALKAIAAVAPIVDYYEFNFTPQGARILANDFVVVPFHSQYNNPALLGDPARLAGDAVTQAGCPFPVDAQARLSGYATGIRSQSYYEERDLTPRLRDVRAAVLAAQGYLDAGHFFQDRTLTASLHPGTPFRELRGWWYHEHPGESLPFDPPGDEKNWEEVVMGWFDYWLKGVGPRPRLTVDHQDQAGEWHTSREWPPREATEESLFLASGTLATSPGAEPVAFHSVPPPHETSFPSWAVGLGIGGGQSLCTPQVGATYFLDVTSDVVLAGNPYANVRISSDMTGGLVSATLYDVAPDFQCGVTPSIAVTSLASGGADLEYYISRYEPLAFPIDTPIELRIDLTDVTAVLEAGHRLALVISHGEYGAEFSQPGRYPNITVYPESQVVLPVTRGSFGGIP